MDILVILLIVFGVVSSFSKKYKEQSKATQKQNVTHHAAFTQPPRHEPPKVVFQSIPRATPRPISPEEYSPMLPKVQQTAQEWTGSRQEGSMGGAISTEGMDICDASLGHQRLPIWIAEDSMVEPLFGLEENASFSPDVLLQGVIMSEILTHPSQRKWGRR